MADPRWAEQAKFMREFNAIHAEWAPNAGGEGLALTKLVLAPPQFRPSGLESGTTPAPPKLGPAARLMAAHNTQFASSRMRPPLPAPVDPDAAVPRAVRAKRAAADGAQKNSKRST